MRIVREEYNVPFGIKQRILSEVIDNSINMVRTKADRVPTKAVGAKAPHKVASTSVPKKTGGSKGKSYSGGNPYHPRETPEWQKPITNFLNQSASQEHTGASSSKNTEIEDTDENDTSTVETE